MYSNLKSVLESQKGHDGHAAFYHFYEGEKEKFRVYYSSFTSEKDVNYRQTLFGTIPRIPDIKNPSSLSCELPLFYLESESLSDLQRQHDELYIAYNSEAPKVISEGDFSPDVHNNSLNLTLLLKTFPPNYLLQEIINDSLINMIKVKTNRVFNTENRTFSLYINEMVKGNYNLAKKIIFKIRDVSEQNYQALLSLKRQVKKNGKTLSENEFKQDPHLRDAIMYVNRCNELINKHDDFYFQYLSENLRILEKRINPQTQPQDIEEESFVYINVYEEQGKKNFDVVGNIKSLKEYEEDKPIKMINLRNQTDIIQKKSELEKFLGIDSPSQTNLLKIENAPTPFLDSMKRLIKAKEWEEKKNNHSAPSNNPPEDGPGGPH